MKDRLTIEGIITEIDYHGRDYMDVKNFRKLITLMNESSNGFTSLCLNESSVFQSAEFNLISILKRLTTFEVNLTLLGKTSDLLYPPNLKCLKLNGYGPHHINYLQYLPRKLQEIHIKFMAHAPPRIGIVLPKTSYNLGYADKLAEALKKHKISMAIYLDLTAWGNDKYLEAFQLRFLELAVFN